MDLFDVRGRRVVRLAETALSPGRYRVPLGSSLAAGVYFARVEGAAGTMTRKVVVLR
ncbi:MAG: T9SS type A sorting domain-containing protein [Candidatus Eiseniibacteriota bacterium]